MKSDGAVSSEANAYPVDDAFRRIQENLPPGLIGRFYSPGTSVGLGKGKIYQSLIFPLYDPDRGVYVTVRALAYVLTHECDVDSQNERVLNQDVLICPIVPLQDLLAEFSSSGLTTDYIQAFLGNLGAKNIPRVVYMPPISEVLPYGGIMYLNQITHTHISAFEDKQVLEICAVTAFGLRDIEYILDNHLLRPKADRLAYDESPAEADLQPVALPVDPQPRSELTAPGPKNLNLWSRIWRFLK